MLNGTMYAMKPYTSHTISQTPYTDHFLDVLIDNVTHRIIPVETQLNFTDIKTRTLVHSTVNCFSNTLNKQIDLSSNTCAC
jgi:hypothetical protein